MEKNKRNENNKLVEHKLDVIPDLNVKNKKENNINNDVADIIVGNYNTNDTNKSNDNGIIDADTLIKQFQKNNKNDYTKFNQIINKNQTKINYKNINNIIKINNYSKIINNYKQDGKGKDYKNKIGIVLKKNYHGYRF